MGQVSMRKAIAHSLNIPTVKLAEETGYGAVVDMARRAGMNMDIQPTPAVALGAYEVTPLEIAGAYTIFANHGIYAKPYFIAEHCDSNGGESVVRQQAAAQAGARSARRFPDGQPAGRGTAQRHRRGRAGTRHQFPGGRKNRNVHDGWFAGFTSQADLRGVGGLRRQSRA